MSAQVGTMFAEWVVEALHELGGQGTPQQINKYVWDKHESDIRAIGDLVYEWQFKVRSAGELLRKSGVLAADQPRGMWALEKRISPPTGEDNPQETRSRTFEEIAQYVIEKNDELLRRLAR